MSDKKFNFELGNRGLTAEESVVFENAKRQLLVSLERHNRGGRAAGSAIFRAISNATAVSTVSRPRGTSVAAGDATSKPRGTDIIIAEGTSWRTNKVASAGRRY